MRDPMGRNPVGPLLMDRLLIPGERVELPIDWRSFRIWAVLIGILWVACEVILFAPAVARWLNLKPIVRPGVAALVVTGTAGFFFIKMAWPYWRSARLVFTTSGIWQPRLGNDGRFLPWSEVTDVKLIDYGRGGSDILLRSNDSRLKINTVAFQNPYALSHLIRNRVKSAGASALPVTGEL
jgi:hypothetical protein